MTQQNSLYSNFDFVSEDGIEKAALGTHKFSKKLIFKKVNPTLTKLGALTNAAVLAFTKKLVKNESSSDKRLRRTLMFKNLAPFLLFGTTTILSYFWGSKAIVRLNPKLQKKIKELEKLKKALHNSHSPAQQRIFDEMTNNYKPVVKDISTFTKEFGTELITKKLLPFPKFFVRAVTSPFIVENHVKENISGVLLSRYENSLTEGQMVIYKNIIDTETRILQKTGMLKAIVFFLSIILNIGLLRVYYKTDYSKNLVSKWEESLRKAIDNK